MWFKFFLDQVKQRPHSVAIRFQRDEYTFDCLTYDNLYQDVLLKYSHLKNLGVRSGETVAYLSKNSLEHITLLIASNMLGATLLPINFRLSELEIVEILNRVDPKLLFVSIDFPECQWGNGKNKQKYFIETLNEPCYIHEYQPLLDNPYQVCLMLFTSGSTGNPKGVLMHSKMLKTNIEATVSNWNLVAGDKTIVETPFFHTGGYNVLCLPLLSIGGECLVKEKFDAKESLLQIKQFGMTVYFGVPTMFQMMLDQYQELQSNDLERNKIQNAFENIKFFVSGGAPIQQSLIESYQKLQVPFKQGFGMTEIGPNCFLLEEKDAIRKLGSIGKPMDHTVAKVRHENGQLCKAGEVGELELGGEHLCLGYLNDDELFRSCRNDGLLKTGDLVKFDDEGYYYVVGRKKNMFISGGENVYPAEVEKAIDQLNLIHQAIVVPVKDNKWGEVGLCFFQRHPQFKGDDSQFHKENLRELLLSRLSKYKVPQHWVELNEMPLLPNGKIDRNRLKNNAENAMQIISQSETGELVHFMV